MSAHQRHRRIRRAKQWLRYLPRRAIFHRYPFIGRFAEFTRRRAYLWSFRPGEVRPAIYVGSILALMPAIGLQLPLALALSVLMRTNFMVMGGLQFVSNPFSAAPLYLVTHKVGAAIIDRAGFGESIETEKPNPLEGGSGSPDLRSDDSGHPTGLHWSRRLGTTINSLVLGGLVVGSLLGLVLDTLYRILRLPVRASAPTDPPNPPTP